MAKYDAATLRKMAASGQAMPDGSYPIGDKEDLANAIRAVGRGAGSHDAIRRHIMKRAKALGAMDQIPDTWMADGSMKMASVQFQTDNLLRAYSGPDAVGLDRNGRTLYGHFAVFDSPATINDGQGDFVESIAPGAFDRTIAERGDRVKVLFNHGQDPSVGNKPLGTIRSLAPDRKGVAYEVDLFDDTSYVQDLLPALRAGAYGASMRMRVVGETWDHSGDMPARSIDDADLYEFGPVTFPAYPDATANVRSLTVDFQDRLMTDRLFLARFIERAGLRSAEELLERATPPEPDTTASDSVDEWSRNARRWVAERIYQQT